MLYFYLIPSFITGLLTFSCYSLYGLPFIRNSIDDGREQLTPRAPIPKPKHNVPVYMWDIYKNGISNAYLGADVVKGVKPNFMGPFFRNQFYPNHGKQEIQFVIPETVDEETLTDAEIRIMTNRIGTLNVSFQIFLKGIRWSFLDAKSVPPGTDWISLKATPIVKGQERPPKEISILILSVFQCRDTEYELIKYLEPVLLLSYNNQNALYKRDNGSAEYIRDEKPRNVRRKRSLSEQYEEETNRIWEGDSVAGQQKRVGHTCRRKPLYIEFSDIDYDTWILAPAGYEAYQCVGKCSFPVSEHLSPTKHAIVQSLMHRVYPTKVGRACCVPTRLDSISVLYVDNNGILTFRFRYQDMVVVECGCR